MSVNDIKDPEKSAAQDVVLEQHQLAKEPGYEDRLQRQYGTLSIISTALVVDSAWISL